MLVGCGQVEIVQTTNILDGEDLEDVGDAQTQLHVRHIGVHEVGALGEVHELVTTGILWQVRVVLVGQTAVEHIESNELTPLQVLYQRYAVEELTIEAPLCQQRHILVVDKLHIVDRNECLALIDV